MEDTAAQFVRAVSAADRLSVALGNSGSARTGLIYLYRYKTCPKQWVDALLHGSLLKECREELELGGYSCILPGSFAKIFVRQHQWDAVMDEVAALELRRTDVIVADEIEPLLNATVDRLRSKSRPKVKTRALLTTLLPEHGAA